MRSAQGTRYERHFGDRVVRCFIDRLTNTYEALERSAQTYPDKDAVVFEDTHLSYRDMIGEVARVATALAEGGVGAGDRVALLCGNRPEFLIVLYAVLRLGAIAVPVDVRLRAPEVGHILSVSGARVVVCEAQLRDAVPQGDVGIAVLDIPEAGAGPMCPAVTAGRSEDRRPATAEDDPAIIVFTSGTTGRPKGAVLAHINIEHSCRHFQDAVGIGADDRIGVVTPITHVTGLIMGAVAALHCGATVLLMGSFRARAFLEMAARERMTQTVMVPAMYSLCLLEESLGRTDLSAWRIGNYGGAPMPAGLIRALADRLPHLQLVNGYGASEVCSPASMLRPGEGLSHAASVGRPLPCADILVMDETGRELPRGEVGELWIAGPMVSPGYWNDPAATGANFVDGYWRSGDLGSIDAEGYVSISDRIKDVVNRGGYKVYSAEVESVLSRFDGVLESAVVGRPSPVLGERVHAFVSLTRADVTEDALRSFCAGQLADYKVPESFSLTQERLPRSLTGKLEKRALRELAAALPPIEPGRNTASSETMQRTEQ